MSSQWTLCYWVRAADPGNMYRESNAKSLQGYFLDKYGYNITDDEMDAMVGPRSTLVMIINMLRESVREAVCSPGDCADDSALSTAFAMVQWGSVSLLEGGFMIKDPAVVQLDSVSSSLFIPDFWVTAPEYGTYIKRDDNYDNGLTLSE